MAYLDSLIVAAAYLVFSIFIYEMAAVMPSMAVVAFTYLWWVIHEANA